MINEELALAIKVGDDGLTEQLWQQNKGVLKLCANRLYARYFGICEAQGVEFADVEQLTYFALLDAVRAYDENRGYKFTSYLDYSLRARLTDLLGLRGSKRDASVASASLDEPVAGEDDELTLSAMIADPDGERGYIAVIEDIYRAALRHELEAAISTLPEQYALVIRAVYFEGKTRREVAKELGVTSKRASEIVRAGIARLRKYKGLMKYCEW